jgi:hypothetical protein
VWDGAPHGGIRHIFDFRKAVNWAANLRVAEPRPPP